MTLVLSFLSRDFVVQASDRRVTFVGTGEVAEDQYNKAVFFCGHSAWAFTGAAKMGSYRTPDWISNTLSKATSYQDGVEELRSRATTRLRNVASPHKSLALLAVGFASQRLENDEWRECERFPILTVISNFHDDALSPVHPPSNEFNVQSFSLPSVESFLLFQAGCSLSHSRYHRLIRLLATALKRGAGGQVVARLLCRAVREGHDDDPQGPVGRNVMCTVVSRDAPAGDPNYESGLWPLAEDAPEAAYFGLPGVDRPSKYYFYVPGASDDRQHRGPDSVCVGVQIRNVQVIPVGPSEERRWEMSVEHRNS